MTTYLTMNGCITLTLIPLIGVIAIIFSKKKEREIALITGVLTLIESIRV
jgi:hypothetical protein